MDTAVNITTFTTLCCNCHHC